jgi:hypothetical protein
MAYLQNWHQNGLLASKSYSVIQFSCLMIRTGINTGWSYKRLGTLVYLVELFIALLIGLQVMNAFEDGMGSSMELDMLMTGYDFTTISDFFRHHADVFNLILYQLKLLIPAFMVVNVFVTAGLLYAGEKEKPSWSVFWAGGTHFFVPFLANFLIYLLLFLLWTALCFIPATLLIPYFLESLACEIWLIRILSTIGLIYLLGVIILINGSMMSKSMIISYSYKPFPAFKKGMLFSFRHIKESVQIFVFFLVMMLAMSFVYHLLVSTIAMQSWITILIVALVQQVTMFFRVIFRLMYIYSIQSLTKAVYHAS